jgi:hypothetical protein
VLYYRTPDANDSSKAAEQKPVDVLATSSVATTSAPPPLAGPGLMACTYNDAMSSTQSVLLYLESLKDVKADQKGNRLSSLLQTTCSFADCILRICVALSTKLEVANKALAKERAARQSCRLGSSGFLGDGLHFDPGSVIYLDFC